MTARIDWKNLPIEHPAHAGGLRISRTYTLVTPMIGGGSEPWTIDRDQPVNGKAVRGHLRFWWRVLHAGRFESLEALHTYEHWLFGGPSEQSSGTGGLGVKVKVDIIEFDKNSIARPDWKPGIKYLAGQASTSIPGWIKENSLKFTLCLDLSDQTLGKRPDTDQNARELVLNELNFTLDAWELFGGIGARTRRGFGGLQSEEGEKSAENRLDTVIKYAKSLRGGAAHTDLVRLKEYQYSTREFESSIDALNTLGTHYQQFRRGHRGNNAISAWPENNELAKIRTGRERGVVLFPRAQLGLPINFLAAGGRKIKLEWKSTGDKHAGNRYASPLHLRVLNVDEKWRALAVVVTCPSATHAPRPLENLVLRNGSDVVFGEKEGESISAFSTEERPLNFIWNNLGGTGTTEVKTLPCLFVDFLSLL